MKIVLVRHGRTIGNSLRQYIGRTDQPLTEEGEEMLRRYRAAGLYPAVEFVFTSPMRRCMQTREILYPKVPFACEKGLREWDFGEFEGKTHEDMKDDPAYRSFIDGSGDCPGGEERAAFFSRCQRAFVHAIRTAEEKGFQSIAVVAHGGTIMAVMERFAVPPRPYYEWQPHNGCGFVTECREEKGEIQLAVQQVIEGEATYGAAHNL